ncbi:MAG: hypothetical protein NXI20_05520 [bacterium]|nr:hypothetical protein [bacterium]
MKALARELLWFFTAVVLCMPIAYLFAYLLDLKPEGPTMTFNEEVFQMELFIVGAIIGFIGTYIMRVIIWAMKKYLIKEENDS